MNKPQIQDAGYRVQDVGFCILSTAFWMLYRFLATLVLLAILPVIAFPQNIDLQQIHVQSALVSVPVIVNDSNGRFVPGLTADAFSLFQDGIPVPVSLFLSSEDPIKIAFLLDTSRSTTTVLDKIKKSALRFLLEMRPQDRAMVVSFDSDIQVLCPLSSDYRELTDAISRAKSGGTNTRLRDAIMEIAQRRFRSITGRKAIVLLTDGEDHGSEISVPDLLDGVAASSTLIYSISYHVDPRRLMKGLMGISSSIPKSMERRKDGPEDPWQQREEQAANFLEKISELSAGRLYRSEVTQFDKAFKQISDELRSQYLIGFYPDQAKLDGQTHALEVHVTVPDAVVRSRRSYRAVP
jgi:Ca-activated chloride channel family protein